MTDGGEARGVANPGLDGVLLCDSEICLIEPEESLCALRGHRIEQLAEERGYDEVAHLLLYGTLPDGAGLAAFRERLSRGRRIGAAAFLALERAGWEPAAHPMDLARSAVSLVGLLVPDVLELPPREQASAVVGAVCEVSARVCRHSAGLGSAGDDLSRGANMAGWFLATATGAEPPAEDARALEQVMILHAEHELNASTFAARVVASTLSDLLAAVVAAIAALKGPLHGGANEMALADLKAIGAPEGVAGWVGERLRGGGRVMGFGHRVYKRDPRVGILARLAEERSRATGRARLYETARALEAELAARKGLHANPDLYSGMIYEAVGLRGRCATVVFTAARTAGWLAHAVEQLEHNRLIRPRARYVGPPASP